MVSRGRVPRALRTPGGFTAPGIGHDPRGPSGHPGASGYPLEHVTRRQSWCARLVSWLPGRERGHRPVDDERRYERRQADVILATRGDAAAVAGGVREEVVQFVI